ncbi:MAG: serine/threonine protein kinase [Deltaproteobacteria bacterium]|nr:serine/threonine protein kinase [Deltaproteobacteria bacterium]
MTDQNQRVDLTGRVLMNKLRVERLLGEGGMGAVYEVEHLITRHRRALKVMHSKLATNAETIARFIREAGVAGTLRTPYVVETFDAGQLDDGSPYVLMELLEGKPLAGVFDAVTPLSAGRLVGLICQVLEGLAVAHRAGIVHRDIKPDNVFVGMDDRGLERVRILDFGISKFTQGVPDYQGTLTSEGAMMGTPYYMSPEQALGVKDIDPRSDLYSVGVMLYEGLARRRPYEGQTLAALVLKIHHGDHERIGDVVPSLPKGLADAVEKAMSVDAARRFSSAEEMLAALVPHSDSQFVTSLQTLRNVAPQFAETLDAPVGALKAPPPKPEPAPSSKAIYAAAGLVVLAVVAFGVVMGLGSGDEPPSTSTSAPTTSGPSPTTAPPVTTAPVPEVPSGVMPPVTTAVPVVPPATTETVVEPPTTRVGRRTPPGTSMTTTAMSTEPTPVVSESMSTESMATMSTAMEGGRFEIDRGGWDDE